MDSGSYISSYICDPTVDLTGGSKLKNRCDLWKYFAPKHFFHSNALTQEVVPNWYRLWPCAECIIKNLIFLYNSQVIAFSLRRAETVSLYPDSSHTADGDEAGPGRDVQPLLSGNLVRMLMKESLLTPNLTPAVCARGGEDMALSGGRASAWEVDIPQRLSN